MSTTSFSGRAILTGQPEGGYPIMLSYTPQTIHTAVTNTSQVDTIYIYAYTVRRAPGDTAGVRVEVSVLDSDGTSYVVTSIQLPGLPTQSPTVIVNGQAKNSGVRITARCLDGYAAVFGYYNRSSVNISPSVSTLIGELTLGYQTISFSGEETRLVSTTTPVTFITTSHTTSKKCIAYLGAAKVGTIKYIVMLGKSPLATSSTLGTCEVRFNAAVLPSGEGGVEASGTVTLQDRADSLSVLYTGTIWIITNSGCFVN